MDFNIFNVVILLGAIQGIIFGIYLASRKKKNIFLSIILWVFSLTCISFVLMDTRIIEQQIELLFVPLNILLAFGPSIFFYIKKMTNEKYKLSLKEKLYYLPVLLQFSLYVFLFLQPASEKIDIYQAYYINIISPIEQIISIVYTLVFLMISYNLISKYEVWLKDEFSEIKKYTLQWLKRLLAIYIAIWLLWTFTTLLDYFMYNWQLESVYYYYIYIPLAVFTYWIGFSSYSKKHEDADFEIKQFKRSNDVIEFEKDTIDAVEKLKQLMTDEKMYLNPDLKLLNLADAANMKSHFVSNVLNSVVKKNFHDFVNYYRVEEVKKQLLDNKKLKNYTILGVAYESGFNSKSTFNDIFKKQTGLTPTQYLKRIT